jgi:hypothetical protein
LAVESSCGTQKAPHLYRGLYIYSAKGSASRRNCAHGPRRGSAGQLAAGSHGAFAMHGVERAPKKSASASEIFCSGRSVMTQ